jgi:hypothetical protein
MQPHQQRVVDEKTELDEKLAKLNNFIGGEIYNGLPGDERYRLTQQSLMMKQYSDILGERIAAF